jgi:hypothetical protein
MIHLGNLGCEYFADFKITDWIHRSHTTSRSLRNSPIGGRYSRLLACHF